MAETSEPEVFEEVIPESPEHTADAVAFGLELRASASQYPVTSAVMPSEFMDYEAAALSGQELFTAPPETPLERLEARIERRFICHAESLHWDTSCLSLSRLRPIFRKRFVIFRLTSRTPNPR